MSDIFKSALDYFSSSFSAEDNDYVGANVELGNVKLKIKRLIAEGKSQTLYNSCVLTLDIYYFTLMFKVDLVWFLLPRP